MGSTCSSWSPQLVALGVLIDLSPSRADEIRGLAGLRRLLSRVGPAMRLLALSLDCTACQQHYYVYYLAEFTTALRDAKLPASVEMLVIEVLQQRSLDGATTVATLVTLVATLVRSLLPSTCALCIHTRPRTESTIGDECVRPPHPGRQPDAAPRENRGIVTFRSSADRLSKPKREMVKQ